ncbi:hypothetical protein Bealeia2_02072 (plasmid) [Candidatus Bealeia paramacronuclearis]|nr:hypothetical protein [Candidatus Bealeia paramacronuclearis]
MRNTISHDSGDDWRYPIPGRQGLYSFCRAGTAIRHRLRWNPLCSIENLRLCLQSQTQQEPLALMTNQSRTLRVVLTLPGKDEETASGWNLSSPTRLETGYP